MLSVPKAPERDRHGDNKDAERDSSADFIQELAEKGTANELGTVKAASDAAEKGDAAERKRRSEDDRSEKE